MTPLCHTCDGAAGGEPPLLCCLPANAGSTVTITVFVEVNQLHDFSCLVVTLVDFLSLIFSPRLPALVGVSGLL